MVGGDRASSHEKLFFTSTLMPGFSKKLELPSAFARHIIPGKIAKIRDPLGFQWPINVQGDAPNFCFGDGWERFTKVYMLEVGYVLIFLYEGNIPPNFRITLKPNNLDGHFYLIIPVKFKMDAGLQKARKVILRDSDGDDWETDVLHSTKNRALLSRGWRDFCKHNKPRPGDDCEFQLCPEKKEDTKILQVCIFRKSEEERQAAIKVHRTCGVNISPEPSFWITITTYGLRFFSFPIPNPFVKATKMSKKKQVVLKDESGHLWTMGLVHTTRNRVQFANRDWKSFCCRNNIQSGDILEFRAAHDSEGNNTFHVQKLDGPPDSRR